MTKFPKFKIGDSVHIYYQTKGMVVSWFWEKDTGFKYKVSYATGTDEFRENELKFWVNDLKESRDKVVLSDKCPICNKNWTKTVIGNKTFKDCIPCGKKAEDISMQDKTGSELFKERHSEAFQGISKSSSGFLSTLDLHKMYPLKSLKYSIPNFDDDDEDDTF